MEVVFVVYKGQVQGGAVMGLLGRGGERVVMVDPIRNPVTFRLGLLAAAQAASGKAALNPKLC